MVPAPNIPRDDILRYIGRKLQDQQFLYTYATIVKRLRDDNDTEAPKYQIVRFLSIGYLTLKLLHAMSKGQTTLDGINGYDTAFIGARLQTAICTARTPFSELSHYRDLYYVGSALCGILLRPSEPYQGTWPPCLEH
jgi:hypothetical protein